MRQKSIGQRTLEAFAYPLRIDESEYDRGLFNGYCKALEDFEVREREFLQEIRHLQFLIEELRARDTPEERY